jgi:hypothetical protein
MMIIAIIIIIIIIIIYTSLFFSLPDIDTVSRDGSVGIATGLRD